MSSFLNILATEIEDVDYTTLFSYIMSELYFAIIGMGIWGVVFGIISAIAAHRRDRSVIGWFFLGFFFGPLPWIILIIVDRV